MMTCSLPTDLQGKAVLSKPTLSFGNPCFVICYPNPNPELARSHYDLVIFKLAQALLAQLALILWLA